MILLPIPKQMEFYGNTLAAKTFYVNSDNAAIKRFFDFITLASINECDAVIYLKQANKLADEQYKIEIFADGILIEYSTEEGAYRAATTLKLILLQCVENNIPFMKINDYPSIKNRGYMLDVSRGKMPKIEYLKSLIDILSDLKYNQLQLYMESIVFDYKNFPEYTKDKTVYTRENIQELDKYCRDRFITLVPNQNSMGHMGYWTREKELSHLAITGKNGEPSATLNPLCEESIELIDKIYDGLLDAFSCNMVNIGMDETVELGLNETKNACDVYGRGRVYTDFLKKVCELAENKYNKTPMFWDDIIFKHEEEIVNIPKNAVVMQWGYETEHHYDRNCRRLSEHNLRFYVCPGSSAWGSITGRSNNAIDNISLAAECGAYYNAEGFLLTEWGDGGHPQFPPISYLPLVFGGSASWNSGDCNHEKAYEERRILLGECKAYLDKFIFKTEGDTSLADIVYRMGNYYLVEDMPQFNLTELIFYRNNPEDITADKIKGFKRVIKYMSEIKEELCGVKADRAMLSEIKLNCEMVILTAELMCGNNQAVGRTAKMLEDFKKLWNDKNFECGTELFENKMLDLMKKIKAPI